MTLRQQLGLWSNAVGSDGVMAYAATRQDAIETAEAWLDAHREKTQQGA